MNVLAVHQESFSNSTLLIELLQTPGTKETVTDILNAVARAVCCIVNDTAARNGIPTEDLFDTSLTLKMTFMMPTVEDMLDPKTHVEVHRR